MKKCDSCGKDFSDDKMFCTECGIPLTAMPDAEPIPSDTVQSPKGKTKGKVLVPLLVLLCVAALVTAFYCYDQMEYYQSLANSYISQYNAESQARQEREAQLDEANKKLKEVQAELKTTQEELGTVQAELTSTQQKNKDDQKHLSERAEAAEEELSFLLSMLKQGYGFGSQDYYAEKGVVVLSKSGGSQSIGIISKLYTTVYFRGSDNGISCEWGEFHNNRVPITITPVSTGCHTVSFTNDANRDSFDILVIVTD